MIILTKLLLNSNQKLIIYIVFYFLFFMFTTKNDLHADTLEGIINLNEDTNIVYQDLTILNGTTIITNGYKLSLKILNNLNIEGTASIIAYNYRKENISANIIRQPPPKGKKGQPSFNPGPWGDESRYNYGYDGGYGKLGIPALHNKIDGKDAGDISIEIFGLASGHLRIKNNGTNGYRGGDGGEGGDGGNGQQGRRAFRSGNSCSVGPGIGGMPGIGGSGGAGGVGGDGGDGGNVDFSVRTKSDSFNLSISTDGGFGGSPGLAGLRGLPGLSGCGGRGSTGISPKCTGCVFYRSGMKHNYRGDTLSKYQSPAKDGTKGKTLIEGVKNIKYDKKLNCVARIPDDSIDKTYDKEDRAALIKYMATEPNTMFAGDWRIIPSTNSESSRYIVELDRSSVVEKLGLSQWVNIFTKRPPRTFGTYCENGICCKDLDPERKGNFKPNLECLSDQKWAIYRGMNGPFVPNPYPFTWKGDYRLLDVARRVWLKTHFKLYLARVFAKFTKYIPKNRLNGELLSDFSTYVAWRYNNGYIWPTDDGTESYMLTEINEDLLGMVAQAFSLHAFKSALGVHLGNNVTVCRNNELRRYNYERSRYDTDHGIELTAATSKMINEIDTNEKYYLYSKVAFSNDITYIIDPFISKEEIDNNIGYQDTGFCELISRLRETNYTGFSCNSIIENSFKNIVNSDNWTIINNPNSFSTFIFLIQIQLGLAQIESVSRIGYYPDLPMHCFPDISTGEGRTDLGLQVQNCERVPNQIGR